MFLKKNNIKIFFLAIIFSSFFSAVKNSQAATYYIDYAGGNDTNNGTSTNTPWQHSPGDSNCGNVCASTVPTAGDTFYFKKGVEYFGQINFTWSGISPASGTTGMITENGVLTDNAAAFITAGLRAGDYIYIYNNSTTGAYINSVGLWVVESIDSQTQITLDSYSGAAHLTNELAYKIIRPISLSSFPGWGSGEASISGNNTYYYLVRPSGNYFRMDGISLANTAYPPEYPAAVCTNNNQGAIWNNNSGIGHIYENLKFNHVWQGEIVNGLSYAVVRNNEVDDFGGKGLMGGEYSLMESNTLRNGVSSLRSAGKYSVVRKNIIIDSNGSSAINCGNHADGIGPFFSSAAEPGENKYGWIYGNYISNTVQGIYLEYDNNGTSNWTIHSNVLVGHYGAGGSGAAAIYINSAPNTKIYNNTIFGLNGGAGWIQGITIEHRDGTNSDNSEIKNNVLFSTSASAPAIGIRDVNDAGGLVADYNWFYIPNRTAPFMYGNSVFKTFAEWQALGFDVHSFNGIDAGFMDIVGLNYDQINLQLRFDSGLRDAGTSLFQVATDLVDVLRPQGGAWDIGAYEFVGNDIVAPAAPSGLSVN